MSPQRVILFIDNSRMSIWMVISIIRDLEHQTGHSCPNALAIVVSYAYPPYGRSRSVSNAE